MPEQFGDENNSAVDRFLDRVKDANPVDDIDLEEEPRLDDDDFEIGASPDGDESGESRDEKRRKRGELYEAAQQSKQLMEENRQIREQLANLQGQAQAFPAMLQNIQSSTPQADPIDSEIEDVYNRQNRLFQEYQRAEAAARAKGEQMDPSIRSQYEREAMDLDGRKTALHIRKAGYQQPNPQQAQQMQVQAMISAQHPDVMGHAKAKGWVQNRYNQMLLEGRQDSWDTLQNAMDEARQQFHLSRGNSTRPTYDQRSRYTGHSKGSQGSSTNSKSYRMTSEDKRMANALYSHIDDEGKRLQMWVNKVAKRKLSNRG